MLLIFYTSLPKFYLIVVLVFNNWKACFQNLLLSSKILSDSHPCVLIIGKLVSKTSCIRFGDIEITAKKQNNNSNNKAKTKKETNQAKMKQTE